MISRRTFNLSAIIAALSPLAWFGKAKAAAVVAADWLGLRRALVDELLSDSYTRYGLKATDELREELMSDGE